MIMTTGTVNKDLLPMVPVSIRNGVDQWHQLNVVLDTGFNGELRLDAESLASCGLPSAIAHTPLSHEDSWSTCKNSDRIPPIRAELLWCGAQRLAEIRSLPNYPSISGILGTNLLRYKKVTIDVIEEGAVTVDPGLVSPRGFLPRWRSSRKKPYRPRFDDPQDHVKWAVSSLPYTCIQVQDNRGQWHNLGVNIDTGSSGQLSLPTKLVNKLGLRLPDRCRLETVQGSILTECGPTAVRWRGRERHVDCTHRPDDSPPLVGMQLFRGNRITIEFDFPWPTVETGKIPGSPKLTDRLFSCFIGRA